MVSALWKAAAEGDIVKVRELLKDAPQHDIEIKGAFVSSSSVKLGLTDHTGVTPLIQAVKEGHLEVVRELIAKGADPKNASSQGPPESYTQDPAILQALGQGNGQAAPAPYVNGSYAPDAGTPTHTAGPGFDVNGAGYPPAGYWYMPPNGVYAPYGYMPPPPPGQEGMPHPHQHPMNGYYTPPQPDQQPDQQGGSPSSHIPPEIARTIACRYFPMCKYGASCMFAHPTGPLQGPPNASAPPFFPGPPPNMGYPAPYDGMMPPNGHPVSYPPPPHGYYAMPPQPQPYPPAPAPPNGVANGVPHPPHSPVQHTNGHSPFEGGVAPPPVSYPFPPSGGPPQVPQAPPHIAIPNGYHPAPVVVIPGSYNHSHSVQHSPVSPIRHRKESSVSTFGPGAEQTIASATAESGPRPPFAPGYRRGGGFRRVSLGGNGYHAKQPCLFFPAGKCKNGNECRFPHVRPEDDPAAFGPEGYPPQSFPQRHSNGPRPMGHFHNPRSLHTQRSFGSREESEPPRPAMNGNSGFRNFPSDQYHNRPPNQFNGQANGAGAKFMNGRGPMPPAPKEKVLTPADFPSLGGNGNANGSGPTTPASANFGHAGLTAAQVLKRSAPKDVNGITDGMAKITLANGGSNGGLLTPPKEKQHQPLTTIRAESPELPDPIFPSINDTMGSPLGNKVVVSA